MILAEYESRVSRPRPEYYLPHVCRVNATLDGECASYFVGLGEADHAYEFARWAARWARWSMER